MNSFHHTLYDNLLNLVEKSETFSFSDSSIENTCYRIFTYRLASYKDFLNPDATECRGTTFEMDTDNDYPARLVCLPMPKFWNLNENPETTNVHFSNISFIEEKADGSLISTFIHYNANNEPVLYLKTKGSLESSQCLDAMDFINRKENCELKQELFDLTSDGYTINLEWCSPDNRIVLNYDSSHLKVLNIRSLLDGSYLDKTEIYSYPLLQKYWIKRLFDDEDQDIESVIEFIQRIPDMKNIEGFVITFKNQTKIKIKTSWYLTRHKVKETISSPRRLCEAVLAEETDDIRSLFHDDASAIKIIDEMEQKVQSVYNHLVNTVEKFYNEHKHLDRKTYVLTCQKELNEKLFPLVIERYVKHTVDYNKWIKKQKIYGNGEN